jgi:hypothetical protein
MFLGFFYSYVIHQSSSMNNIELKGVTIFPFSCNKWEFESVKLISSTASSAVVSVNFPCLALPSCVLGPLQFSDLHCVCPEYENLNRFGNLDVKKSLGYIKDFFNNLCEKRKLSQTKEAKRFLDIYYQYIQAVVGNAELDGDCPWSELLHSDNPDELIFDSRVVFSSLLPMPEIWIYAKDTILEQQGKWYRSDIGFWTGERLILVEIQGGSHVGKAEDVARFRAINSLDQVDVIYLHNDEIHHLKCSDIMRLLPESVWRYWQYKNLGVNPVGAGDWS